MRMLTYVLPESTIKMLEKYVSLLGEGAREFANAVRLLNSIRIGESKSSFTRAIRAFDESGVYKSGVELEVANLSLDPGFKEELLYLVSLLDEVGDRIKEASREFTIIPFLELPQQLRDVVLKLAEKVSESMSSLVTSLKLLVVGRYEDIEEVFKKILKLEEEADSIELSGRELLLELAEKVKPYALQLLVYHLITHLEEITDLCARASSRIRLFIKAWLS